jgi:hypothetical protein
LQYLRDNESEKNDRTFEKRELADRKKDEKCDRHEDGMRDHEARVGGIAVDGPPVMDKIRRGCRWKRRFTFERTVTMRVSV